MWSPDGLDVAAVEAHADRTGAVTGVPGAFAVAVAVAVAIANANANANASLLTLDVDLLVPATVEGVLHRGNAGAVRACVVVAGCQRTHHHRGDRLLEDHGVLVVADILANADGVIVPYFEWVQANQGYWWSETELEARLADRMSSAWPELLAESRRHDLLRTAVTYLAVRRVAEAHR